jgi:ribose transport system ATP-binding protein
MSTTPGPELPVVLSLRGVSKSYGAVQAVKDVSVDCRAGEIHALVGENGSGKSTLLGIASGFLAPDEGSVQIGGKQLARASVAESLRLGVGMAYQTYSQVLDMSVAENLYLATPAGRRPGYGDMEPWAARKLAEFNLQVPVAAAAGSLSLPQRQLVEVVKALLAEPKVLLLDEPTTALGPDEIEQLHALVFERSRTGVGVIYVSHRLPEVLGIADRITVLRDGVSQGTFDAAGMSEDALVALMIGRPLGQAYPDRDSVRPAEVGLEVAGLEGDRFGPVDIQVHRGEILGLAGAEGNGQVQLLRAVAGVDSSIGTVRCNSTAVDTRSPLGPLRAGVLLLSGDRNRESLFPVLSVRSNTTIQVLRRFSRMGVLSRARESDAILDLVRRLNIRLASIEQPVLSLSGGNQQKVSLTRPFLRGTVHAILADEPTQGVDVGARFDIYEALRGKAREGAAIVVKSSDPLELAGLCDRVVVMSRGKIVDEIPEAELSERRIVEAIVGSRDGTRAVATPDRELQA